MAKVRATYGNVKHHESKKKKTTQGNGRFSKTGSPGPDGGGKRYRKPYRGQGK